MLIWEYSNKLRFDKLDSKQKVVQATISNPYEYDDIPWDELDSYESFSELMEVESIKREAREKCVRALNDKRKKSA
jgi:hypothetical protein